MMKHCFILVTKEDIALALDYYSDINSRKKFASSICFVPDSFVLKHYKLFMGIKVFVQSLKREGDKLDYHGRTIIPPESATVIKHRFDSNISLRLQSKCNKRIGSLYKLLQKAGDSQQYIVHIGI
ncbi:MAG: hypothetical protein J6C26_09730 [Clostridia bacterium]|nr:hypothetical protein [Clostridia bacterium]